MSKKKRRQIRPDALERVKKYLAAHKDETPEQQQVSKACEKYAIKLAHGDTSVRADRDTSLQMERYERACEHRVQNQSMVRQELYELGVLPSLMFNYLVFGSQVDKLTRRYKDEVLRYRAWVLASMWTARGLDFPVLEKLLKDVFHSTRRRGRRGVVG